jgi:pimeloyl-ACP methyl ester carboxylesterase
MIASWMRVFGHYLLWVTRPRNRGAKGRVDVGDIRVFYRSFGSGAPVLLLHGGFAFGEAFAGQIPALAGYYQVIAMDSRGHGRTTLGGQDLTYRGMAADAASLVERLGLGPVHVLGWSDGGTTGIALAIQRPDLVRSLVLAGAPFSTRNYGEDSIRAIEAFLKPSSPGLLAARAIRRLLTPEPNSWPVFFHEMVKMWWELPDFTVEDLGRIEAPTLVLACDRDEFLSFGEDPFHVFRETAEAIPRASLALVPGGTHSVLIERAETVNPIILDFLVDGPRLA